LQLSSTIDAHKVLLTERDLGSKTPDRSTGVWKLQSSDAVATGARTSPDGKRTLSFVL
jgi:hypothetical protein